MGYALQAKVQTEEEWKPLNCPTITSSLLLSSTGSSRADPADHHPHIMVSSGHVWTGNWANRKPFSPKRFFRLTVLTAAFIRKSAIRKAYEYYK